MTHSVTPKFKPSDVDLAYEVLVAHGRPMYYYDLIKEVITRLELPLNPAHISSVLTQINLDTRFTFLGKSEWGLKAWVPTKGSRKLSALLLMNKDSVSDEDEPHILDEEGVLGELDEEDLGGEVEDDRNDNSFEKENDYDVKSERTIRNSWK